MCQIVTQMLSHLYRFLFSVKEIQDDCDRLRTNVTKERIAIMEEKIAILEHQNRELQKQVESNRSKEEALQKVLCNYDNLLKKVLMERKEAANDEVLVHVANLEHAFYDLLLKYEKARDVVKGFQKNEQTLKDQVQSYESLIENLKGKFLDFKKTKSVEKITLKESKSCQEGKGLKKRRLMTTM